MLSADKLDQVCVVLVRARNPSNIGAVARAMHDFGFRKLRVVNAFPVPFEAARSAVDASAVMAGAEGYASVAEAVGDCTLVVGTTAVGERDLRHDLLRLPEAALRVRAELRRDPTHDSDTVMKGAPGGGVGPGRVALLFGSEKTGLSNEEMSHCNWLLTVPMQGYEGVRHPSMNLGQAVAVCLYELVREAAGDVRTVSDAGGGAMSEDTHAGHAASAAELERLSSLLSEVLDKTEYTRRHPADKNPAQMRRLVRRMGADAEDAPVWMGILRQVLWKLARPR